VSVRSYGGREIDGVGGLASRRYDNRESSFDCPFKESENLSFSDFRILTLI
jgi:hypothetical protein